MVLTYSIRDLIVVIWLLLWLWTGLNVPLPYPLVPELISDLFKTSNTIISESISRRDSWNPRKETRIGWDTRSTFCDSLLDSYWICSTISDVPPTYYSYSVTFLYTYGTRTETRTSPRDWTHFFSSSKGTSFDGRGSGMLYGREAGCMYECMDVCVPVHMYVFRIGLSVSRIKIRVRKVTEWVTH